MFDVTMVMMLKSNSIALPLPHFAHSKAYDVEDSSNALSWWR